MGFDLLQREHDLRLASGFAVQDFNIEGVGLGFSVECLGLRVQGTGVGVSRVREKVTRPPCMVRGAGGEIEFFIDSLLVRIHFIIVMIRWAGLAPWEFEFRFPGSHTSTFLGQVGWSPTASSTKPSPLPVDFVSP